MAKMFYSLEETAGKLGVSEDEIKQMAEDGKLQQFRDGEKLMFKRDQVDDMASLSGSGIDEPSMDDTSEIIPLAEDTGTSVIELSSGDTDVIDLVEEEPSSLEPALTEPTEADLTLSDIEETGVSGISVFDADTGDTGIADMPSSGLMGSDEELALDNIGSGSGLLDLTRETDDTSLGAELLNEIYPSGGEGDDGKQEAIPSGSGVFDSAAVLDFSSGSGLETIRDSGTPSAAPGGQMMSAEAYDPIGSGLTGGLLIGATVCLMVVMVVALFAMMGVPSAVTAALSANLPVYDAVFAFACLILGLGGFLVGRAQTK